jgi:hydrogenase nickel incorporation protein HypA/HybF
MHELAVTQNILEIALRHAHSAEARRITDLHLVIGELSTCVDDSVQFYWDLIAQGTPAEGARLHFRRVPTELQCRVCRLRYRPAGDDFACPTCHASRITVVAGEEFYLEAIDVDADEPEHIRAEGTPP